MSADNSVEISQNVGITRRQALRGLAGSAGALFLTACGQEAPSVPTAVPTSTPDTPKSTLTPEPVKATPTVVLRPTSRPTREVPTLAPKPTSNIPTNLTFIESSVHPWFYNWYQQFPLIAGQKKNGVVLPTLQEKGGPAEKYDTFVRNELGQPSHVQEYIRDWTNAVLNLPLNGSQDYRVTWGHCNAVAASAIKEKAPPTLLPGFGHTQTERIGFLAMFHAGDIGDRPTFGPKQDIQLNINHYVDQLATQRQPFVTAWPRDGFSTHDANDYRIVYAISSDRKFVMVTGLGEEQIVPVTRLQWAHYPLTVAEARAKGVDEYLIAETRGWRYTNAGLREDVVKHLVYGDALVH